MRVANNCYSKEGRFNSAGLAVQLVGTYMENHKASNLTLVWDYDGTLMDSSRKNFAVNNEIFKFVKPSCDEKNWPVALTSVEQYQLTVAKTLSWQDFYLEHLGLTEKEMLTAGSLWSEYQLKNKTPSDLFDGIPQLIQDLHFVPQGICSLNSEGNIVNMLKQNGIAKHFKSVVGYDSLPALKPKPHPEAFLHCLQKMAIDTEGIICYIGDHQDDVRFARNAEVALRAAGKNIRILSISVCYSGANPDDWEMQPDYKVFAVEEIMRVIQQVSALTFEFV